MSERKKLILIIAMVVVSSAIVSSIVYGILFKESKHNVYIGIVTSNNGYQESIKNGIDLFIKKIDKTAYVNPKNIKLISFDASSQKLMAEVNGFVQQNDVIGFISHSDFTTTKVLSDKLKNKTHFINLASIDNTFFKDNPQYYSTVFNESKQAKFIANYARNVLGLMIITIVHDNTEHGMAMAKQFGEVYERFGTKIHYTFPYDKINGANSIGQLINGIKDKQDLGTIFFIGSASDSASFVVQARDANLKNKIIGTNVVATHAFNKSLADIAKNKTDLERYTNEIIFPAPLLFDTAGSQEQQFKNDYLQHYGVYPDWVSAYGFDAAKLLLNEVLKQALPSGNIEKNAISKYISGLSSSGNMLSGATGDTWFNEDREAQKTIQIGIFDGHNIVAAPTQLQAIKLNSSVNYLDELKSGKMLYVNDRFMYKTNVIYTGIELNDISKLDMKNNTAELDFSIWFRYRGNFDPADLLFMNAASDLSLDKPLQAYEKDGVMFKRYKLKHEFKIDFSAQKFRYGSHVLGISFRHKNLNKNNVIYVIDDLGMNFNAGTSLKDKVISNHVLNLFQDWKVIAAQFFQSITVIPTFGEPTYVGYGAIGPDFSKIDYEVLIAEDRFNLNDYVKAVYFIYIGIFGLLGSIAARMIEHKYNWANHPHATGRKDLGYKDEVIFFWLASAWVMRVVFWFITLLSIGNLIIEIAIDEGLSNYNIDLIVMAYRMLWWVLSAVLTVIALNLFLWGPLEKKSQRKIPGLIKHFTTGIIYLLYIFCIIAFVFDQPLSSLLATSGLFAMILGLGVQSNIANIVSGIVVNLEKPFTIGDFVKIKGFERVEVIDITWRCLKVKDAYNVISIPNSSVASSEIVNYSEKFSKFEIKLYVSPNYEPELILDHIKLALANAKGIHDIKPPEQFFNGIVLVDSSAIAEYLISFSIYEYKKHKACRDEIWKAIYHEFNQSGINFEAAKE